MTTSPTHAAVLKALTPLRSMLEADGYDLEVAGSSPPVELTVVANTGCGECLIPRTLMEPLIADMLLAGGLDRRFVLRYPEGHVGA